MNRTKYISAALFAMSVLLPAQAPSPSTPPSPAKPSTSISVSGCLQKTETEAYTLTTSEGRRFELRTANSEIKFADHVNQQVTATGATGAAVPSAPPVTKVDPQGFLDVITLVVLNPTCKA
jgi:hypothetical protein